MLSKAYSKTGKSCRVTFSLKGVEAGDVHLCGEFNGWDRTELPLIRRKDGRFSRSVQLDSGRRYRFRYLLDGRRWVNDTGADAFVANPFGTEDSVLEV